MISRRVLFAGGIAVILGTVAWIATRPPSLESSGERIIRCIESSDASCLWDFTAEKERTSVLSSKANLRAVVEKYLGPELKQLTPTDKQGVDLNEAYEQAIAYKIFARSDGRKIPLAISLFKSDDRIVAPYLATEIAMFVQNAKYGHPTNGEREGFILARALAHGAQQDAEFLQSLGMSGMIIQGSNEFADWDAYARHQRARVAKIDSYLNSAKRQNE